jgi:hypothetical protein
MAYAIIVAANGDRSQASYLPYCCASSEGRVDRLCLHNNSCNRWLLSRGSVGTWKVSATSLMISIVPLSKDDMLSR